MDPSSKKKCYLCSHCVSFFHTISMSEGFSSQRNKFTGRKKVASGEMVCFFQRKGCTCSSLYIHELHYNLPFPATHFGSKMDRSPKEKRYLCSHCFSFFHTISMSEGFCSQRNKFTGRKKVASGEMVCFFQRKGCTCSSLYIQELHFQ